jgi:thymidylate synthase (FAD)
VNAARVSFDKESEWEKGLCGYCQDIEDKSSRADFCSDARSDDHCDGNYKLSERDEKLIGYLASHGHWTPFSHCFITLRETVPIFVARQRFKHMVGFSYNEVSRRYVDSAPTFFVPEDWRKRAVNKKQGSSDSVFTGLPLGSIKRKYARHIESSLKLYREMLLDGVCPEQARMVLPQSMYTSYYVSGSLAAWGRMYKQRIDPHAQKEIQDLAIQVGKIIEPLFPTSWKVLTA